MYAAFSRAVVSPPPGSFVHQVQLILDTLGTPPAWDEAHLGFVPREDAGKFLARQKPRRAVPFEKLAPRASGNARSLLRGLLLLNPKLRTSCAAALAHPFFEVRLSTRLD